MERVIVIVSGNKSCDIPSKYGVSHIDLVWAGKQKRPKRETTYVSHLENGPGPRMIPFLETQPVAATRRLLLVTYSFPPDARVGALRWERMLQYAADWGWTADVLLMDPDASRDRDDSRLTTLPPGLRLFGIPFPETPIDTVLRWRRRARGETRVRTTSSFDLADNGDLGMGTAEGVALRHRLQQLKRDVAAWNHFKGWERWARRASAVGIELARDANYDCVVSSGPPHMAHEAARLIASSISRPLVIDFRDPWTTPEADPPDMRGRTWRSLSHRFEEGCVSASSLIALNTESARKYMSAAYPSQADRMITVMNGADPIPATRAQREKRFNISYTGSLYGGRKPEALFRALRLVAERNQLSSDDVRLHFMGVEEPLCEPLLALAREETIDRFFVCEARRPRSEATALLDRSAMLVVLPQHWIHSIPAKVFEYVQRSAWILALSEPSTAIAELLHDTAADIVAPDDVEAIAAAITRRLQEWRRGVVPEPVNADNRFSRERQAQLFFTELDRVLERAATPA